MENKAGKRGMEKGVEVTVERWRRKFGREGERGRERCR